MGNDVSTLAGGAATAVAATASIVTFRQVDAINGTVFQKHFLYIYCRGLSKIIFHKELKIQEDLVDSFVSLEITSL